MPAAWIRERRKHLSLTQTALAIRVGVTQAQVSQWETSRSIPSTQHMARLTDVLGTLDAAARSLGPPGDGIRTDVGVLPARSAVDETYRRGSVAAPIAAAGGFAHLLDASGCRDVVRVVEATATQASVELFLSPVGPRIERRTVPRAHVEPLPEGLPEQTLVYRRDGSAWRLGRTDSHEIAPEALASRRVEKARDAARAGHLSDLR
jgi:transcriptional regulator with XRE-family HTH domain